MSISLAIVADIPNILRLNIDEYWDNYSDWENTGDQDRYEKAMWWGDERSLSWYHSILERIGGGIFIIRIDGIIVGELDYCITTEVDDKRSFQRVHIIWLLVDKKFRRQGLAEKLIEKLAYLELPIWVEDEDERSNALYNKLGVKVRKIVNYFTDEIIVNSLLDIKTTALSNKKDVYDDIRRKLYSGELRVLIGNYYAPSFDIAQLQIKDPLNMIWGGMNSADIVVYRKNSFEIYAILTQYSRIYIAGTIENEILKSVLADIFQRSLKIGFENIELQFYENNLDPKIITDIGFTQLSNDDNVYLISK